MLASKFKSIEHYQESELKGYHLLPLTFIRLNSSDYVLSNFVGEYLVLSRDDLFDLVNHKLASGTDLYNDLKSKHFLYDDDSSVAIDLLTLKKRTKLSSQANFTSLHIFVVTLRCDYSCPYCQVSRQTEDKAAFDMSEGTAEAALEMTFKSPSPAIKIEFQGGEPLLNFPLIKKIVHRAQKINLTEKRDLQFVIATNLSMLNDEILDFCLENDVYLSTSLDGPEDIHNKNRPRPGKNGYELTSKGILSAKKKLGDQFVSALMTTTKESMPRVKEIIDEYIAHGFNSIFLRPLSPYGFAITTRQTEKYDTEQWIDFYKEGLEYIFELNKAGYPFSEQYATIVLRKMFSPTDPGYVDLQSPAGAGIAAVVYNYDGDVYASDEARMLTEMGDNSFRLGNLSEDSYEDIFLSDVLLDVLESSIIESVPGCSDCGFKQWCGADPIYHHATQADVVGNKSNSGFCQKNMAIFRHIVSLLENDPEKRNVLLGWVG